jgi:methionyl-tRNA formyltransferase
VKPLRALVDAGYEVPLVVSAPDKRRGRGGARQPSPVKAAALDLGLAVTDRVDDLLDVDADLGMVVAFGRLLRPPVLQQVPLVNLHFSLLPRWRGAAPVERALLAGDEETGVALMAVEEGLDTGAVYDTARVAIGPDETLDELRGRLVDAGTELLLRALRDGFPSPVPQQGEPTYAEKLTPDELRIDWHRPADEVHRVIRLGAAWTTFRGKRLKVLRARLVDTGDGSAPSLEPGELSGPLVGTGSGPIELLEVQPEGRAAQAADAWTNGARLTPGDRLGS